MAIGKVIELAGKFITDKDELAKFEVEYKKYEVEDMKNKIGSKLETILYLTFPIMMWLLAALIIVNACLGLYCFFNGRPAVWLNIDDRHWQMALLYLGGFFGGKNIDKWKKNK